MQLSEVIGQDVIVKTLEHALLEGKISHAYLFAGESGVGKETIALSLINHLLCKDRTACGHCPGCQKLARRNHPGFFVIDSDSSIKIDQMRALKEKIQFAHEHYIIWLIKEAHKMTLQAANSFLKMLEEPGQRIIFILLTDKLGQIIPTIRSRCQVINFPRLGDEAVREILGSKVKLDSRPQGEVDLIIKMARGSIGRAIELWDSPILERRRWVIEQLISLPDMSVPEILGLSQKWIEERETVEVDLELMLQWYRDLLFINAGINKSVFNLDYDKELKDVGRKYSIVKLNKITSLILEMLIQLQRNVRVRFIMGYLLLQMRKEAVA